MTSPPASGPAATGPESGSAASTSGALFTRQATGLVKAIRTRDAFSINMGVANPGLALPVFGLALALYTNSDLTLPLIIGGVVLTLLAAVYSQLVATMPRSGGDYLFVGRILNPALGAAVGGAWLVMLIIFGAIGADILGSQFIPAVFSNLGTSLHSSMLQHWATSLSGHWGTFLGGSAFMIVFGAITALGPRFTNKLLVSSLILGLVGIAVVVILLVISSTSDFATAFHANNPHATYSSVVSAARHAGWTPGVTFSGTLGVLPYAILLYAGFSYAVFPGGEIRQPARTYTRSVFYALAACIAIYVVVWLLARNTMGFHFLSAVMFLGTKAPATLASTPSISTYAGYLTTNWFVGLVVTISFVSWGVLYIVSYFVILSRLLFAFAFDRILPTRAASVVQRTGAPVVATVVVVALLIAALAVASFSTFFGLWTNATLTLMVAFVASSIAAMLLPYRRRDLYDAGAKIFNFEVAGVPGITVIAAINAIIFVVLTVIVIRQPSVFGTISARSIVVTVVSFAWGLVAYFVSSAWHRRHGIPTDLALKALPPE